MKKRTLVLVAFLLMLCIAPPIFTSSYAHVALSVEQNRIKDFAPATETLVSSSSGTAGDSAINAHTDTHTVNDIEYIGDSTGTSCYVTLNFTIPTEVDGFNYYTQTDWNLAGTFYLFVYNWDTDGWDSIGAIGAGPFIDTWKNGSVTNSDHIGETQVALRWYQGEGTGFGLVSVDYASIGWYTTEWYSESWLYRQNVTITGSAGAGTNYQVPLNVTYSTHMQNDFDDLRFTAYDGITEWDYWIEEYTASTFAVVWVEVRDDLGSNVVFWMYYGNSSCSTTSNGTNTFPVLYEDWATQSVQAGVWTTILSQGSISWSATDANHEYVAKIEGGVGTDRQYYNSVAHGEDPTALIFRAKLEKTVAADQYVRIGATSSSVHGMAEVESDAGTQQFAVYDDASNPDIQVMDNAHFDSYFSFDITRNGTHAKLYIDTVLDETASWDPDAVDQVYATMQVRDSEYDLYVDWIAVREFIDTEPVFDSFGAEEPLYPPVWQEVNEAVFFFPINWDPTAQFGYDAFFIFLGLIMIPASTIYLVRGGRKEMSMDKVFYGLIVFCVGLGLLIGGIMP